MGVARIPSAHRGVSSVEFRKYVADGHGGAVPRGVPRPNGVSCLTPLKMGGETDRNTHFDLDF